MLGGALVAADVRPVTLSRGRKSSLATVPAVVAALLLPAGFAGLVMATAVVSANLILRRRWYNALFNAGAVGSAVTLAGLAAGWEGPPGPAGLARGIVAAALFSAITLTLATTAAARQHQEPIAAGVRSALKDSWPQALALDAIAVAVAALFWSEPLAALLPLAVLPLVQRVQRALEAELRAREQLGRVLAAQRRYLTDISHNVGNPLGSIRVNLSLLRTPNMPARQGVALRDAMAEASHLTELFRRLRVLAETDEELPLKLDRVDLAELVEDIVRAYSGAARRGGVEIVCEAGAHPTVTADADLLRHATANLVENAIHYSPRGRQVRIRTDRDAKTVLLEVADQGPGIDPERLPRIFDRFEKGPRGGSGLGLAIARSVVERHGGKLTVDTRPGEGSTFRIRLPLG